MQNTLTADMFHSETHSAIVAFKSADLGTKPTRRKEKILGAASGPIAPWGDNNLFPQTVIKDLEKSPWVGTALDWKARALYGKGVVVGSVIDYKADGSEVFKPIKPSERPEIYSWLNKSQFERNYLFPACRDLYTFYNVFPELIMSKDRKQIAVIRANDASFCRWGMQNDAGIISKCYISPNWGNGTSSTTADETCTIVDVLDPFYDPAGTLRELSGSKYVYPVSYPTSGKSYYQLAHWNSIRTSGLLEWANAVIKYKQKLMDNQITIKYLIETSEAYWKWKYSNWDSMTKEERDTAVKTSKTDFDNYLQGQSNAGKSLMTVMLIDPVTKQPIPGLKITPIDDLIKDGKYIEDSQEASSHLLYALGIDGTLMGNAPGKGMGAGSGSDKRIAFNNYISLCEMHKDIILEPLYIIRDYNGWGDDIEFRFRSPMVETLDKGIEVKNTTN